MHIFCVFIHRRASLRADTARSSLKRGTIEFEMYTVPDNGNYEAYMVPSSELNPQIPSPVFVNVDRMANDETPEFVVDPGLYYPLPIMVITVQDSEVYFAKYRVKKSLMGASFNLKLADTGLIGNTCQTLSSYTPTDHNSRGVVPHISMPSLPSLRPKKRTTGTFDLLPWNKEIVQGFRRLQNTSSAEIDWARASNRLVEKVERETVPIKDLLPKVRPKRRLILTTQLMQQVLHPPSAAVLSLDASSNFEIIVYSLARLASGDACSLICCTEGYLPVHHNNGNLYGKVNTSDRIRDQYFLKFIEDLSNRWKELESDLVRLDKNASILNFRLDCQDMERFSIINRFAKFHGRAQVDGAQMSSSSDAPSMAHRPYLQRYVSAHPMPRAIPESVQCLSL